MEFPRRLSMPAQQTFILKPRVQRAKPPWSLLIFFALFAAPLLLLHYSLLTLPFFWDEQGQFVPTALDLLRHGWWVARSTLPNVHPPGVELYLVLWYKIFGYSIPITRVAMLALAAAGLLGTFLLSVELTRDCEGAPAFVPPLLLLSSPLFYTQSMMAQLDMPAMVFTVFALFFYLRGGYRAAAVCCLLLVLAKETGIVVPAIFFVLLSLQRRWREALLFLAAPLALAVWLVTLHHQTGYWLGNPDFAHYNVGYSLHPVRMVLSAVRRIYYLFFAEFRFIGTLILLWYAQRAAPIFGSPAWRVVLLVSAANVALVTVLGGAELERYLLPVLPVFYIAVSVTLTLLPPRRKVVIVAALLLGLWINLFWKPPYPFPYENNWAMVDFVRLQQRAAAFIERNAPQQTIATAWPFTAALSSTDYGFVARPLRTVETNDFHWTSVSDLSPASFGILVTYTRTWAPAGGVTSMPLVEKFLSKFYEYERPVTAEQCRRLGLFPVIDWTEGGQTITIYQRRKRLP